MLALFGFIAIGVLLLAVPSKRTSPIVVPNAIAKFGAASVPVGLTSQLLFALGPSAVVEFAVRLRDSLLQRAAVLAKTCSALGVLSVQLAQASLFATSVFMTFAAVESGYSRSNRHKNPS